MTRDQTCEERIADHKSGREDDFEKLFRILRREADPEEHEEFGLDPDDEFVDDAVMEQLDPLAIDEVRHIQVTLSTGGPADGININLDHDGEIIGVQYWFQDWFDGATRPVHTGEALWEYAEWIAEAI